MATMELPEETKVELSDVVKDDWRGDWRLVFSLYCQLSELKRKGKGSTAAMAETADRLAEAVAKVFASYDSDEDTFLLHLRDLMVAVDNPQDWRTMLSEESKKEASRRLYKDEDLSDFDVFKQEVDGKIRPKPFEAAVETVRRINDLNLIRDEVEKLGNSAILGGSLSFGRFFTVRGAYTSDRPSDIDLVIVTPSHQDIARIVGALRKVRFAEENCFFLGRELEKMEERAAAFVDLDRSGVPVIFQHKFNLWEQGKAALFEEFGTPLAYRLALHIVDIDTFDYLTLKDYSRLGDLPTAPLQIRVYRDDKPSGETEAQFSFSGRRRSSDVEFEKVDGGHLATVQLCELADGRFYPGVHLNLIFPAFEVRWENPDLRLRLPLLALRYKFQGQIQDERSAYPLEIHRFSFAHARSSQFARRVTQRLDSE